MRVVSEDLPDALPIDVLCAEESCDEAHVHGGELIGYHCQFCDAVDETLRQIVHEDDCRLAGEHGRDLYGEDLPKVGAELKTPELTKDHPITMVYAGFSGRDGTAKAGHVVAFRCDECGNSDETLFEIVHDENCSLAGRHGGEMSNELAIADGGRDE